MTHDLRTLREVMTTPVVSLDAETSALEAARRMRDRAVGHVLVLLDGEPCGIVTARDLVVRCIADRRFAEAILLGELCSHDLLMLTQDSTVGDAVRLMSERAIGTAPVMDASGRRPVGTVSLDDLR